MSEAKTTAKRKQLPRLTDNHKAVLLGLAQTELAAAKKNIEANGTGKQTFEQMVKAVDSVKGMQDVVDVLTVHVNTPAVSASS